MAAVNWPDTGARSLEAALAALHADAEHKASLKMFFAAADLCRDYHGPFAKETEATRARLAAEYEQRGHYAASEREHEHLPFTTGTAHTLHHTVQGEHVITHWHCPACHA